MTHIATASIDSDAPADAFFARWGDMASWPEWNADTEWVRLDGPFTQGATGVLKPKGGPRTRFVVERLVPGREFVDVSRLLGARLTFAHETTTLEDGRCRVDVRVTMTGPLRALWARVIGRGIAATAQDDLDRLAAVVAADIATVRAASVPDVADGDAERPDATAVVRVRASAG